MYKLDHAGQLAIVALFQKALVTMTDVSDILQNLEFAFTTEGKLFIKNHDICQLTQEEMDIAATSFEEAVDA